MKKTFKKILCSLLVVVMCLTAAPLQGFIGLDLEWLNFGFSGRAAGYSKSGYYYYNVENGAAIIGSVDTTISGDVIVPSTLGGYRVVAIDEVAFWHCTGIKSITFPASITSISEGAFVGCKGIKNITVDTNNSYYCSVDGVLFSKDMSKLVLYPIGNTRTSYSIPNGVESIAEDAFSFAVNLRNITIPDSVTSIGKDAFYECSNLSNITIPNKVTYIGEYAFWKCVNIEEITIPNSVTSISDYAFCLCKGLTNITIPNSVISIGENAFSGCAAIEDVYYLGAETQWNNISIGSSNEPLTSARFHFFCTHEYEKAKCIYCGEYKETAVYGECGDDLNWVLDTEAGVLYIGGSGAMYDYNNSSNTAPWYGYNDHIKQVIIGDGVTTIGKYAFNYADLESITISDSVTDIGERAFLNCLYVTEIYIPKRVSYIGEQAFSGNSRLTGITVDEDNNVYSSDSSGVLFDKNKTILIKYPTANVAETYITPDSVTTINEDAFFNCDNLKSVVLSDNVSLIGWQVFDYCDNLQSIVIPKSMVNIGMMAFCNCAGLKDVYYKGTQEQWKKIGIGSDNQCLTNATIHFNSCSDSSDYKHSYTSKVTIQPTHLEEGIRTYRCPCGDTYTEPVAKLKEHSYTSEVTTEPTHLTEGVKTFTCACGDTYTEPVAKLEDHTYTLEVTTKPTHLTEGIETFTCACGDSYTKPVAKLTEHTYTSQITKQPTHKEEGVKTFTCECGDTYTESVAMIPHSYSEVVTEPTCTAKGYTTYTCECGDTYVADEVSAKGHNYTSTVTTQPTHLKEGVKTFTCDCGDTYTKSVAKLTEHTYTSQITKQPTHKEEGVKTFTCECGDSYTNTIAKIPHSYSKVVTAPTCTSKGYTTYTCECGYSYVGDYVGTKSHSYISTVTRPATHLTEGVRTYTCSMCGDSYPEVIAKNKEHSYVILNIVEPTCETEGYTVYVCECGHSYNGDKTSATGHNYNGDNCTICGESKADNCDCNCHKSGFMGIIWKILRFFYKLFGTNKTCGCGVAHY